MTLYVDCAFLHDIMDVARTVPLAGVTTNPSILLAARTKGQAFERFTQDWQMMKNM
jgi:transaldolase